MNNIYKQLGGTNLPGNMNNVIQNFNAFRNSFQGDAKQQVQMLLNSGKMTQAQFNQLRSYAQQIQKML